MDNKLSELSKPVAWEVKGILCHSEEEAQVYVGEPETLYSQEYVLALLAELQASKTNAEYYKSAFEEQRDHADILEKRLATPVRLPTEHELHQVSCSECAGNCLELVESTVRAAGFTVEDRQ